MGGAESRDYFGFSDLQKQPLAAWSRGGAGAGASWRVSGRKELTTPREGYRGEDRMLESEPHRAPALQIVPLVLEHLAAVETEAETEGTRSM